MDINVEDVLRGEGLTLIDFYWWLVGITRVEDFDSDRNSFSKVTQRS